MRQTATTNMVPLQQTACGAPTRRRGRRPASRSVGGQTRSHDAYILTPEILAELSFYDRELAMLTLLTAEEEQVLGRRAQAGEVAARNELVTSNLRLVKWVATPFRSWSKVGYDDLVQEGNIGLMRAADRYDPERGYRFITFAHWWIRQGIQRAIADQGADVRLPVYVQEHRRKIGKVRHQFIVVHGRSPSRDELMRETGLSAKQIARAERFFGRWLVSLGDQLGSGADADDDEPTFAAIIPDRSIAGGEVVATAVDELRCARARVEALLQCAAAHQHIKERDLNVFRYRYGLDGSGRKHTLQEGGIQFGHTRERFRQIVAKVWKALAAVGFGMDHGLLCSELERIADLEVIATTDFD